MSTAPAAMSSVPRAMNHSCLHVRFSCRMRMPPSTATITFSWENVVATA